MYTSITSKTTTTTQDATSDTTKPHTTSHAKCHQDVASNNLMFLAQQSQMSIYETEDNLLFDDNDKNHEIMTSYVVEPSQEFATGNQDYARGKTKMQLQSQPSVLESPTQLIPPYSQLSSTQESQDSSQPCYLNNYHNPYGTNVQETSTTRTDTSMNTSVEEVVT